MNELACTHKYVVTGKSDVPRWFSNDLQRLKDEFQSHKVPGPIRNQVRNRYTSAVRKAKRDFTRNSVIKMKGGAWKLLNPCKKTDLMATFKDSSQTSAKQLAEEFATHFRNKIDSLKTQPDASIIFQKLTDVFKDTPRWDLSTITREDVSSTIDALKPTLSTGPDKIPNKLLKSLKFEALDAITLVFNKCIEEGVFPDIWKSGKIIPTYKKGAKNKIQNYRPVCLFSNLGKLFEGVVKRQLTVHLERILPPNVFGFRPGRSTQDAVFYAMDKIHRQRAEGKLTAVVSMDASSAFDCVPHEIIIRSLEIIGAGQKMQRWIESFFKRMLQFSSDR